MIRYKMNKISNPAKIFSLSFLTLSLFGCAVSPKLSEPSETVRSVELAEPPVSVQQEVYAERKEGTVGRVKMAPNPMQSKVKTTAIAKGVQSNPFSGLGGSIPRPSPYTMPSEMRATPVQNTEKYQTNEVNPVKAVSQAPVSTFSIDVDTGSYSNVRRFLNNEEPLPPVDAVRAEEMINYFPYQYPQVSSAHPFTVNIETVDSPWQAKAKVIRIGIKANDIEYRELPPANLVFLVDVSGSMDSQEKLGLVKKTLRILTDQLRPQDRVTIVTYASGEQVALAPTSGKDKDKILSVINRLTANGSTSGQRAIEMAYQEVQKSFIKNGINRILIATDGDFNVGITNFETLKGMVAEKRKTGISFTSLGFGTGNYNEKLMEQLADAGDGHYSYIDNEKEAKKVVKQQLSSTLATVAQDVKIQVEFNPATVKEYRLIGYENRLLNQEGFNNDQVDAGDIGAGHTVTAMYEIIPQGVQGWLNDSRYQKTEAKTGNANEYGFLNLRYKLSEKSKSILINTPISTNAKPLTQASENTKFALAVASYAQQLKGGQYNGNMNWDRIMQLAQQASKSDEFGYKAEFIELVKTAKSLSSAQK